MSNMRNTLSFILLRRNVIDAKIAIICGLQKSQKHPKELCALSDQQSDM